MFARPFQTPDQNADSTPELARNSVKTATTSHVPPKQTKGIQSLGGEGMVGVLQRSLLPERRRCVVSQQPVTEPSSVV